MDLWVQMRSSMVCEKSFSIYFSQNEVYNLIVYLDSDQSGDIDYAEFSSKINYNDYNNNYSKFMITKTRFIELVVEQWDSYHRKIPKLFHFRSRFLI